MSLSEAAALLPDEHACEPTRVNIVGELATVRAITENATGDGEDRRAPLDHYPGSQTRAAIAQRAANGAAGRPQDNYSEREWSRGGAA
jgi:hypothetical protein